MITEYAVTQEDHARLEVLQIPEEFGPGTTYGVVMRRDKHRRVLLKSLLQVLTKFDQQ